MKQHKASKGIVLGIMICILFFTATNLSYGEGHWAQDEIDYLLSKGIVSGYPDGTFKPDKPITRAEFIKIINKTICNNEKSHVPFKDVNENDWFYDEIAKAIKSGYVEGYGDNTFRPNNPITREEAAKILVTVFRLEDDNLNSGSFVDQKEISNWAQEYVLLLKNKGYVSGYADGTFRPNAPITRAESVKMITNVSGEIINAKGEYSQSVAKNLLINTSDVTLN
ncbi:MAG: S-layer homology domain-containing protein, partial [Tissierellia bacterium]|nr:S-layer homology domain-containing protein [Tissierellia bacterium]